MEGDAVAAVDKDAAATAAEEAVDEEMEIGTNKIHGPTKISSSSSVDMRQTHCGDRVNPCEG